MEKKQLSFLGIFLLGINAIVGSGIFLLLGQIYHYTGIYSILTIVLAGGMASIIALNYAAMAARYTEDGGAWIYADYVFGRFAGFQVGWFGWWLAVITLSAEIVALLTALSTIIPPLHDKFIFNTVAITILLVLGLINTFGTALMEKVDNITTLAKIAVLVVFTILGCFAVKASNLSLALPANMQSITGFSNQLSQALVIIFYVFTGFNFLPIAARDMKNPEKNLPKALIMIMVSVTLIYAAVQTVAIGLLGDKIVNSTLPVADAFAVIFGPQGKLFIVIGMSISILGVAIAGSFNAPIEMTSLANEKQLLPSVFGKKNRYDSPWTANIITMGVAALLILSGGYIFLVKLIVLASFVQYVPTILAVIKTRHEKQVAGAFTLPGGMILPVIALLVIAYLLSAQSLIILVWEVAIFLVGWLIYYVDRKVSTHKN
ncbi:amino acid transporter [Weissella oryzae SG25]|uniref:Amino acid transporter n=1 Tax=Weissella oryzae (strain DSM 25784 / JCM 18191 / LMG 30913 / SG25) TaxID=1329250 RepID=A0A069CSB7_WEIOS|nr:APC family permease [Weissella oryzae]GAK30349.1 amino acid transporter [Weissella oryzae SG25]